MTARGVLIASLLALLALFGAWFLGRGEPVAFAVFALSVAGCIAGLLGRRRTAGFWSGVIALVWFSHGVMVAWTRPDERTFALLEVALSLLVVGTASLPGLRSRFGRRR